MLVKIRNHALHPCWDVGRQMQHADSYCSTGNRSIRSMHPRDLRVTTPQPKGSTTPPRLQPRPFYAPISITTPTGSSPDRYRVSREIAQNRNRSPSDPRPAGLNSCPPRPPPIDKRAKAVPVPSRPPPTRSTTEKEDHSPLDQGPPGTIWHLTPPDSTGGVVTGTGTATPFA